MKGHITTIAFAVLIPFVFTKGYAQAAAATKISACHFQSDRSAGYGD